MVPCPRSKSGPICTSVYSISLYVCLYFSLVKPTRVKRLILVCEVQWRIQGGHDLPPTKYQHSFLYVLYTHYYIICKHI